MADLLTREGPLFAVLDLEASALGAGSYPIEAGVALMRSSGSTIRTHSTLIKPTQAWLTNGTWSAASEAVHGISLSTVLSEGRAIDEVCDRLNRLLAGTRFVVTDAPRYDQDWLDTLFSAARREQRFTLCDFDALTGGLNADQYRKLIYLLDHKGIPHRAGPDAVRLAEALLEAHLGFLPVVEKRPWDSEHLHPDEP